MDTYFASPEKAGETELTAEISMVEESPVVSGLLRSVGGLLAILNAHRQVVALNDSFAQLLGIDDPYEAFGLRPGEALNCVHAGDEPAGCGTTAYCSSCGAAVAIVSSLDQGIPVEKRCALAANRKGRAVDIALSVRSQPITIQGTRFVLLFVQDITRQEQRASLERTFYHDVNNMLSMLVQAGELISEKHPSTLSDLIRRATMRLSQEVAIQRALSQGPGDTYQPMWDDFSMETIFQELGAFFENHPAAKEKLVRFKGDFPGMEILTDICLLQRVLSNMIINALEATEKGGIVEVWAERKGESLDFCVWNSQAIPPEISKRIFQRNFSTKSQAGRGIGTYSMKLFGENILGGAVSFTSSRESGTVFKYSHSLPG